MANEMSILKRLKSPTPKFFKKLRNYALSLSAMATAVLTAPQVIQNFILPDLITTICQWFIVAGLAAAAVSSTSMEDNKN